MSCNRRNPRQMVFTPGSPSPATILSLKTIPINRFGLFFSILSVC
ncbi:MAG: hypothetical protein RMY27_14270 [Nostoc sp. DedQUE09]|nr:hypothetical protein [Nostoc sp. DedQUE09]